MGDNQPQRAPSGQDVAELDDIYVINDDVTIEKPIDVYYEDLQKRLENLKHELGTEGEMPTTFEKYLNDNVQVSAALQRNVREYYNDLKLLRADTQVNYPVPHEVYRDEWDDVQDVDPIEYTHCRYTPVTTEDARDFGVDGYSLRLQRMNRHIKLLICITLYNEDQDTLRKTIIGVCENLEVLYEKYVGKDGRKGYHWQEVAVAIVQDGIGNCSEDVLASGTVQGFFSPVILQDKVLDMPVTAHLFEYTARYKKHAGIENYPPLQILFATKAKNKGKLDSHCWYFDAFSYLLQPDYCILFDAGTRPMPTALQHVCAHFARFPEVGALTGELRVERPYRTFLTSVQFAEWKVAHILQKPIESICGYLTVLPGAFSAFRWLAVEGEPLRKYFHGLYSQAELNAFEANMYLAEDRVLCLEVVAKKNCRYRLEYVKDAIAEADPVTRLIGLMKQRRRWLNGTFFAMLYALGNMGRIWTESGHAVGRKFVLTFEMIYLTIVLVISTWFGIGILFAMLYQLLMVVFGGEIWLKAIGGLITLLYLCLIVTQLVVNIKNKPEAVEKVHSFCAIFFCLYMLVFTAISIVFLVTNDNFSFAGVYDSRLGLLVACLLSAIVGVLLTALLHGEIGAMMGSGFQYWIMQPAYFNMLQMNAFCNVDDISWGTKNLDTKKSDHDAIKMHNKALAYKVRPSKTSKAFWDAMTKVQSHLTDAKQIAAYNAKKEAKLKAFSSYLLLAWLCTNIIFVAAVSTFGNTEWESCEVNETEQAVNAVQYQAKDPKKAAIIADLMQTAVTVLRRGTQLYPFYGLDGFPQNYPLLVSGDAQSASNRGSRVTVLANATELFGTMDQSMPSFEEWLRDAMGINATATLEDFDEKIWLPMPVNQTIGYDTSVSCTKYFGYNYYLVIQFIVLVFVVLCQVGGSIVFIMNHWWRKIFNKNSGVRPEITAAAASQRAAARVSGKQPSGEFEIAIQPGSAKYPQAHMVGGEFDDAATDASFTPRSGMDGSPVRRRLGRPDVAASPKYVD